LRLISLTTRFIPLMKRASEDWDLMMKPGANHFLAQRIVLRIDSITRGIGKQYWADREGRQRVDFGQAVGEGPDLRILAVAPRSREADLRLTRSARTAIEF
jgi:hypothetical protein